MPFFSYKVKSKITKLKDEAGVILHFSERDFPAIGSHWFLLKVYFLKKATKAITAGYL